VTTRHDRHYTLDEARAELPWVRHQLADMREARDKLTDEHETLTELSPTNGGGAPGRQVSEAYVALQTGIGAFEERGIVLRDLDQGLIDFPAIRDGREIYLCWIHDEPDIAFWHDLDAGYAGRQPL
jgi:hypothetical protein